MGTSRRTVIKALAGLVVAGSGMSWLEACTSTNAVLAQPITESLSIARPKMGTTLLTYYGQPKFKVDPIAWSPDGKRIASGYIAEALSVMQVWDAVTGKTLLSCRHGQNVYGVAWSPDGRRVASGGGDSLVRIWDAVRDADATIGTTLLIYKGHSDSVVGLAWSPDGRRCASGGTDTTVQVWDVAGVNNLAILDDGVVTTRKALLTYKGHSGSVINVPWSPDGTRIASGGTDTTVQVWEATTGKTLFTYRGHSDLVFDVAWSPDGTRIASASADTTVQVWQAV